ADPDKFYQAWCNYKVAPMAGNIQLVFFRKKGSPEDVIVKLLLHEHEVSIPVKTDMAPFYHWQDVRAFYKGIVDSLPTDRNIFFMLHTDCTVYVRFSFHKGSKKRRNPCNLCLVPS